MKSFALVPLVLLLAACVSDRLPPAPGDDGARRSGGLSLPRLSLPGGSGNDEDDRVVAAPSVDLAPADEDKLTALSAIQARALFDAFSRGGIDARARATSRAVLTASPLSFGGAGIVGDYRCRTLKHGGAVPFIVYGYFDCRISAGPNGLMFEKTTGSQRMTGRLFAAPMLGANGRSGLAYAGTQHSGPRGAGEADTYPLGATEVGLFERIGEDRYRLRIPAPGVEGSLDVIDLVRPAAYDPS